jgi:hypothetical protein
MLVIHQEFERDLDGDGSQVVRVGGLAEDGRE